MAMSKDNYAKNKSTSDVALGSVGGGADLYDAPVSSYGLYNVFNTPNSVMKPGRDLASSNLWLGVPKLTEEQMRLFEAAYSGHTFFFVTQLPKFMTTGAFADATTHYHMLATNLGAIIEKSCVSFSGQSEITVNTSPQEDGAGRKIEHVTGVQKDQGDISLKLHEFAGLPVKNALEAWVTGIYDPRSQHGNYAGNLGIDGGWCLANHTMSILVAQVDPSWQVIQDAAYYCNMVPKSVPFDGFSFDKGNSTIIEDYDISFAANEIRSKVVMEAAATFMNKKILSIVNTEIFDHTQQAITMPKI